MNLQGTNPFDLCRVFFQYYLHREKMKLIDREHDLEKINRVALKIAREVANETGTLMAGNICNTNAYDPNDPSCPGKIMEMFKVSQISICNDGKRHNNVVIHSRVLEIQSGEVSKHVEDQRKRAKVSSVHGFLVKSLIMLVIQ